MLPNCYGWLETIEPQWVWAKLAYQHEPRAHAQGGMGGAVWGEAVGGEAICKYIYME
jgi:hypothetical protein